MKKLVQSPFTAMVLGGISFLLTVAFLIQTSLKKAAAEAEAATSLAPAKFWDGTSLEVDQLLAELKREKEELEKRGQLLAELETRLAAERAEINTITQRVHQMQIEFDQNIVRVREEETANLRKLAKVYATMTPEGASTILNELDDASIVKIFMFMKEAETAPLLEMLAMMGEAQARRAAGISEQIRRSIADKAKK